MARMWEEETKAYKVLVGNPEGKRPSGNTRCRWENGIRMDLRDIGCRGVERIQLAQDWGRWQAIMNVVMNFRFPVPQS
jgi:hypothetical protein